jgi:SAM-dependent methyltransferase
MSYVLGTHPAGFSTGDRLIDLGCGPGFASFDLAERVGLTGQVLGIDQSANYITHLNEQAAELQLPQLKGELLNLAGPAPLPFTGYSWDGAWCRWLCMFLVDLNPLLQLISKALRPGAMLVFHEYIRWDTFSLHPHGTAIKEFVDCCIKHWRSHGGDPDVATKLPTLLRQHDFQLVSSYSLLSCATNNEPKAQWLVDFLNIYPAQLIEDGVWSRTKQQELELEILNAKGTDSLWLTPTLVEQIWVKK